MVVSTQCCLFNCSFHHHPRLLLLLSSCYPVTVMHKNKKSSSFCFSYMRRSHLKLGVLGNQRNNDFSLVFAALQIFNTTSDLFDAAQSSSVELNYQLAFAQKLDKPCHMGIVEMCIIGQKETGDRS